MTTTSTLQFVHLTPIKNNHRAIDRLHVAV